MVQSEHSVVRDIAFAIAHVLVSTAAVIVVSGFLTFFLFSILHILNPSLSGNKASVILTEIPGFPVQTTLALLTGIVVGKYFKGRIILWTWLLPAGILLCGTVLVPHNGSSCITHFIGRGCNPAMGCFDQFLFTLPFLTAVAYSFGALIAKTIDYRRMGRSHS